MTDGRLKANVQIGNYISEGFNLFTQQWQTWVLISLVALLVTFVSAMCLVIPALLISGPLAHSLFHAVFKQMDGQKLEVGDCFYGFKNRFMDFALVFILLFLLSGGVGAIGAGILMIGPFLGSQVLSIIGAIVAFMVFMVLFVLMFYLSPRIAFLIPHMIRTGKTWREAYDDINPKVKANYWMLLLFVIAVNFIAQLGSYACYVGLLATFPLYYTMIAKAYMDLFEGQSSSTPTPAKGPQAGPSPSISGSSKANNEDTDKTSVVSTTATSRLPLPEDHAAVSVGERFNEDEEATMMDLDIRKLDEEKDDQ